MATKTKGVGRVTPRPIASKTSRNTALHHRNGAPFVVITTAISYFLHITSLLSIQRRSVCIGLSVCSRKQLSKVLLPPVHDDLIYLTQKRSYTNPSFRHYLIRTSPRRIYSLCAARSDPNLCWIFQTKFRVRPCDTEHLPTFQ